MGAAKHINHYAFDDITEDNSAYWFGFLFADGYLDQKRNQIKLHLSETDLFHLYKFRSFLDSEHTISCCGKGGFEGSKLGYQLQITSSRIANQFKKYGWIGKADVRYPRSKVVYNTSFWRGVFDGDGCINYHKGKQKWRIILVGHRCLLDKFCSFVAKEIGYYTIPKPEKNIFRVEISGESAIKLIRRLYPDNGEIALTRKSRLARMAIEGKKPIIDRSVN